MNNFFAENPFICIEPLVDLEDDGDCCKNCGLYLDCSNESDFCCQECADDYLFVMSY